MKDKEQRQLTPVTLRKRAGLTQRKVAAALDIREQTVSEWERGVSVPRFTASSLKKMMQLYNCTIDELIEAFEGQAALEESDTTLELNIPVFLKKRDMSVAEFTKKVQAALQPTGKKISRQSISLWINGHTVPRLSSEQISAIAQEFQISTEETILILFSGKLS